MKVAPVSADLLIKLALAAAAVGALVYAYRRVSSGLQALPTVAEITPLINPASNQNLVYQGVNAVGGAVAGRSDWSLGSWVYDVTHPNENLEHQSSPPPKITDAPPTYFDQFGISP